MSLKWILYAAIGMESLKDFSKCSKNDKIIFYGEHKTTELKILAKFFIQLLMNWTINVAIPLMLWTLVSTVNQIVLLYMIKPTYNNQEI